MGVVMTNFKRFAGGLLVAVSSPALAVTSINYSAGSGSLPADVTVFQDFEAFMPGTPGASIGPNAFVFSGSVDGQAARPAFGSTGNYATVQTGGSYSVTFGPTSTFSFVLGSLDTYNTLRLTYADNSFQDYIGGQIINDLTFPSGNQISGETNGVVTYRVTSGAKLTGATFTSSQNSFEFDNLAVGAVPEPAAWAVMLGGFGMMGAAVRRRRTQVRFTYA